MSNPGSLTVVFCLAHTVSTTEVGVRKKKAAANSMQSCKIPKGGSALFNMWLQGHLGHQHQLAQRDESEIEGEREGSLERFYGPGLTVVHVKPTHILLARIQS